MSAGEQRSVSYKVVETMTVTDEQLERIINRWTHEGWLLDGIHFAMGASSKRPAMAFVLFSRDTPTETCPSYRPSSDRM